MRIVIFSPFAAADMQKQLATLPGVSATVATDKAMLATELSSADALSITMSLFDDDVGMAIAAAPSLKWIHFISSGTDPLLRYPAKPGVVVTNSADAWAPTVAEHAVAMLLALQRRIPEILSAKEEARWTQLDLRPKLRSLEATTAVILGFGAIGRRIAALLKPFGGRVIAVAQSGRDHPDVERVCAVGEIDGILKQADAVIAALPSTPSSVGLLDARRLALLSPQAVVVNVGRGETIDEAALVDALSAGRLAGAGLDVYEREPIPSDSALWTCKNLILSPHIAGMGRSRLFERLVATCVDNARRLSQAGDPR